MAGDAVGGSVSLGAVDGTAARAAVIGASYERLNEKRIASPSLSLPRRHLRPKRTCIIPVAFRGRGPRARRDIRRRDHQASSLEAKSQLFVALQSQSVVRRGELASWELLYNERNKAIDDVTAALVSRALLNCIYLVVRVIRRSDLQRIVTSIIISASPWAFSATGRGGWRRGGVHTGRGDLELSWRTWQVALAGLVLKPNQAIWLRLTKRGRDT